MAVKECGSHGRHSPCRYIICCMITFFMLTTAIIGSITCIIIRQRPKPSFILQDATVFSFNVSGNPPNLLTSSFQITIKSDNPNDKIGIYYDRLDVYASYQSQQITLARSIPLTHQEHEEVNVWSPFLGGKSVPIAPFDALSLDDDQKQRGVVQLVVHINGHFRWKVGPFTRTSSLYVKCPAYIDFGNSAARAILGFNGDCSVSF